MYIFQQLIDMSGESAPLLNSLAVSHMKMKDFSQAKATLFNALKASIAV
jgi:hypothetical protein